MRKLVFMTYSDISYDSRIRRHIKLLQNRFHIHIICPYSRESKKYITNQGFKCSFIYYHGRKSNKSIREYIDYTFLLKLKTIEVLRHLQYDLIWTNDFETLLPAYLSNINSSAKIIYDSHEIWTEREGCKNTCFHRIVNSIELKLESMIVKRISRIVTVSKPIADFLKSKWNYEGNIDIIRNIPREGEPQDIKREQFNIPEGSTVFVYIGSISRRRNIDKLIRAFPEDNNLTLLLIGSATTPLHNLIAERRNILHIERIPPEKITRYLRLADIGIHPLNTSISLNHKYALPNKVFQYMQAGLALCMFDGISIRGIIDKYSNGIYGNMNTVESIEANIERILGEDIDEMKVNSRKAYQNKYNWENEKKKLQKLIEDL